MSRRAMMIHVGAGGGGGGLSSPVTITVDHTKCGTADTTGFVMLFSSTDASFKSTANGGSIGNSNDIRFAADNAGVTLYNWEIAKWDGTAGTITARVKVPTLSHTADTVFYLLYDGTGRGSFLGGSAGSVWDANYKSCYGFGDGTTLSLTDLTTNANNGTGHGSPLAVAAAGLNGLGGIQFNGTTDQYVSTTNVLNIAHPTVECWFYLPDVLSIPHGLVGFDNGYLNGTEDKDLYLDQAANHVDAVGRWYVFPGGLLNPTTVLTHSVWHHMVGTADGTTQVLYADATSIGSQASADTYTGYTVANLFIGAGFRGLRQSNALISEVRVSNVARSTSYITATYNNYFSPSTFYTLS